MKKLFYLLLPALLFIACGDDDDTPPTNEIDVPTTYTFERDGASTVSFSGQTDRIRMAEELISAVKDDSRTAEELLNMYANENMPFSDAALNSSTKTIKSKVAASRDFFSSNASEAASIKADFETWINAQVSEVFPAYNQVAEQGVPGQIADGSSTRYVNGDGLELNQAINKGLIGALMGDQMLNNYLGTSVLDEGDNVTQNNDGVVAEGKNYTTMEHKWDEAYGYLFGNSADAASPVASIGGDDSFLNKYLGRVEGDSDFAGIAQEVYDALKLGRAAIVAGDYTVRDQQAAIIRTKISEVIAIRAVYYLQQGKNNLEAGDLGGAFHDLSEGFGFIYSLRFTRQSDSNAPYFTRGEVDGFIDQLTAGDGFWEITSETLDQMSEDIAAKFDFTVAQAGE